MFYLHSARYFEKDDQRCNSCFEKLQKERRMRAEKRAKSSNKTVASGSTLAPTVPPDEEMETPAKKKRKNQLSETTPAKVTTRNIVTSGDCMKVEFDLSSTLPENARIGNITFTFK